MTIRRSLMLGLALASACTDPTTGSGGGEGTGTIGLELQVAPGVALDSITYAVDNPALLPSEIDGTVDVSRAQKVRFVVGGLPPGDGYTLTLTGTTEDGIPCSSAPATFSISIGQTTGVSVALVCQPPPTGSATADSGSLFVDASVTLVEAGPCPAISALTALPSEVDVGGTIQITAASSADATLQWTATGGIGPLSAASGASSTFTCAGSGAETVTVTAVVAGSTCANAASVTVMCDAPAFDAGACSTAADGLGGLALPPGTIVTATSGSTPANAVDGQLTTAWTDAGGGTITFTFPGPLTITGVGLDVGAPASDGGFPATPVFSFSAIQGGTTTALGDDFSLSNAVLPGTSAFLPPVPFHSPVTCDGLSILIGDPGSRPLFVNEITLYGASCPPPGVGGGGPADAGACALGPMPFFGTAQVQGTVTTLGPPAAQTGCAPLTTVAATQGSVTFSVGPSACAFIYVDSTGATYASNLDSTTSFDGTTYRCASPSFAMAPIAYWACPELALHEDGLNSGVSLAVTPSTGAVSISRLCAWSDATCFGATYDLMGPATELNVSGSFDCPDGGGPLTGTMSCGFSTCSTPSQSCCSATGASLGAACVSTVGGSCAGLSEMSGCDGPESCPAGFECCPASTFGTSPFPTATCQATSCPSLN